MRIKKIVLVEPGAPGYHVYSRVALPRLGLPMLAAILRREGYTDIRIYCEDIAPIDLGDVASADLVGISTTTSTALAAYRLGSQVKRLNPRAIVVLGGIHVTFMSHEPFDTDFCARHAIDMPVCDHVVEGEGEYVFRDLVAALEDGERPNPIVGRRLRHSPGAPIDPSGVIPDVDDLPFPDLESIVGRRRMRIAPLTTSRGCPFDCTFCSVIEMFGQKVRYRSIDPDDPRSVIAELRALHARDMGSVFFYDDNFATNVGRTKQLLENMIRANVVPRCWTAQVRAGDIVRDRELLALMRRTHCMMVYMGLESVNPATLKAFNKKQSVEQVVEAIRVLRGYGIRAHGMFVLGSDEDTVDTIRSTADFAIRNDVSTVQLMILTPLPGTRYFRMLADQGRILDDDWTRYDAHHTVFWPMRMSPRELQVETFSAMSRVYRYARCALPALRGNLITGAFRWYAHGMVAAQTRRSVEYVKTLPSAIWPLSSRLATPAAADTGALARP